MRGSPQPHGVHPSWAWAGVRGQEDDNGYRRVFSGSPFVETENYFRLVLPLR